MSHPQNTEVDQPYVGFWHDTDLPIKPGDEVVLPKGVAISNPFTPGAERHVISKRAQCIQVHHILNGSNKRNFHQKAASNPKVVWAGAGGYWREVEFNELVRAGVIDAPDCGSSGS